VCGRCCSLLFAPLGVCLHASFDAASAMFQAFVGLTTASVSSLPCFVRVCVSMAFVDLLCNEPRASFKFAAFVVLLTCRETQGNASANVSRLLGLAGVSSKGCAAGYTGEACRDCVRPGYYRLGTDCLACPKDAYGPIVLVVLAFGAWAMTCPPRHDTR
jgi:hypothetical protein